MNLRQTHVWRVLAQRTAPRAEAEPGRKTPEHLTYLRAAAFSCLPTLLTISKGCVPWLEPSTLTHTEAYYQSRAALQTLESFQKGRSHILLLKDGSQAVAAALSTLARRASGETKATAPRNVNRRIRKEPARGSPHLGPPAASARSNN